MIDTTTPNMAPLIDPAAAVALSADVGDIEAVMINGEWRKRDFKLVGDWNRARDLVENARDHLISQVPHQDRWTAVG